jgi:membrane-bound lytic murein transglycosylase D
MMPAADTLISVLHLYLSAHLQLILALTLSLGTGYLSRRFGFVTQAQCLRIARTLMLAAIFLPLMSQLLPRETLLRPSIQIWSGQSRVSSTAQPVIIPAFTGRPPNSSGHSLWSIKAQHVWLFFALTLGLWFAGTSHFTCQMWRLRRRLRSMPRIKTLGRVSILVSDSEPIPYSTWILGRAYVVLPSSLLIHKSDLILSLRHELQHHRNRDTVWTYFQECIKILFFWNPAVFRWARWMTHLQEFACDEKLVGRHRISPQAYGRCLLRVAQSAVAARPLLAGTTGMAVGDSSYLIKRRIEMMFDKKRTLTRSGQMVVTLGALAGMVPFAFATQSLIQGRTIRMDEARTLALSASRGAAFPITMNELVLAKLNRFVGTPEGRRYVKEGLIRMPQYQALIEQKIGKYGFPKELLAIPLYESGFRNDVVSPPPSRAAGIWQFIRSTARRYGLVVTDRVDDRLDAEKETDAAMRYYRDLFAIFQDWRLVLKAYNEGERRVQQLIDQHGTRDPWELERLSTTESYLSGAMAMIIILKNPSLLD